MNAVESKFDLCHTHEHCLDLCIIGILQYRSPSTEENIFITLLFHFLFQQFYGFDITSDCTALNHLWK